jgi:hypothetical protein
VFIINNDQSITFLGHNSPLNNCLGTQASQHCNNTLFKMEVHNLGCYMYLHPKLFSLVSLVHFDCPMGYSWPFVDINNNNNI